jgi:hypothetical protein
MTHIRDCDLIMAMLRNRNIENGKCRFTLTLDEDLYGALEDYTDSQSISLVAGVREAVKQYLEGKQ